MTKKKNSGAALILVLLIVALATSIAVFMTSRQNLWLRQVESQFDRAQARRVGIAAIDWARAVLAEDARTGNTDHGKELWTTRLPVIPVDNGEISGVIEDRQGRFNLNNLVRNGTTSAPDVAQFQRLLGLLGLSGELAIALSDWMDTDSETQYPGGAEDLYYLSLPQPYRAANRPLAELSELLRIKGFDKHTIESLRPYVAVLPAPGPINVNFASPEVLATVAQGMTVAEARVLVQERDIQPFKDVEDFRKRLPHERIAIADGSISTSSQFFLVTGRATIGGAQVSTQALLHRSGGWPSVVWQNIL